MMKIFYFYHNKTKEASTYFNTGIALLPSESWRQAFKLRGVRERGISIRPADVVAEHVAGIGKNAQAGVDALIKVSSNHSTMTDQCAQNH
jgi:hypothetical protein